MSEENRNHQVEESHTSKRRRINKNYESGSHRYKPYPERCDKRSYKNRSQNYQNTHKTNHRVDERYDNRHYRRNHHNFEKRNGNSQRRNFDNNRSKTYQQRDDRFQFSNDKKERDIVFSDHEENFLLDTPEGPIIGSSETKTEDMESTDAYNTNDLLSLNQTNEEEMILTDDEDDFLLDALEPPIPGLSETKTDNLRRTDYYNINDILSLNQTNEEKMILTDDEDNFLLDTPEAPTLSPTETTNTNDMRNTDPSNFKVLLPLNQNNEKEIILPDFEEEDFLSDTLEPPVPGPSGTNDIRNPVVSSFKDLFLKADIIKSLNTGGYEHPSEIQTKCIPQALAGHDILAQAQSGSGKTLAYILSTLNLLEANENHVQILVICPTRELAYQIGKQYESFSKHMQGIRIATFLGGLPIKNDVNVLSNNFPQIVVGTVGRTLSLIKSKNLDIQYLKHFVLDECDQMLKLPNTKRQIQEIFSSLPRDKQVLMFSATLNQETRTECKIYMRNAVEIYMDDKAGLSMGGLVQHYVCVEQNNKFEKLVQLLKSLHYTQMVIFVKSISRCKTLEHLLLSANYSAIGIHRGMNQVERLKRYEEVKNGKKRILVATNVFGRGMDIGGINTVINYDMPANPDCYLHGVARAGRFDTTGTAITFLANEEETKILNEVQKRFQVRITKLST